MARIVAFNAAAALSASARLRVTVCSAPAAFLRFAA
jgi:hypothetical protein